ncbi:ATP synthase F1 subunit beta [Bacillus sp. OxB-1]|nr:ATP synthase F1 subunit beta [Bacillus sp. OxB-1]
MLENMMDLVSLLRMKKVKVREIPKWGVYLRKQWEDSFVNHLNDKEKKSIFLHDYGYLWHVFSYERRKYLKEQEADTAFNKEQKQFCYVFYQHLDDVYILENASYLTAEDFVNEEDVYVVDKEFNWTYVRTHETGWCGPYFSRKDKTN